jgi:two-component system, LytTR family, sensor kinase
MKRAQGTTRRSDRRNRTIIIARLSRCFAKFMTLNDLLRNRGRFFWILNVAGWSGYVLTAYLGALAHEKPDAYIDVIVAMAVAGFLLTIPMRYLYRRLWGKSPVAIAIGVIATSYVLAFGWRWYANSIYFAWVKYGYTPDHWTDYIGGVMGSFYILLCWSGLYFGIRYYQQLQDQTERTLQATAAAHQAQLKMLRYQLNPHFLFNTLNAISTMILDGARDSANLAIGRLSDFLRYTLDNDPMKRVTLGSELGALDLYLEIEKVRFGDRLTIHREVEPSALQALVPSLILQPLIENAVKYAVTPSEDGGTLTISAKVHDQMLILKLSDSGPGLNNGQKSNNGSGVGLQNTRERLQKFYGDRQAFTLAPNDPSGLVVTINIPFETDEDTSSANS